MQNGRIVDIFKQDYIFKGCDKVLEVFWSYSNFENSSITQCDAIKVQFWVCTWCCIGDLIHGTALMVTFGAFILSVVVFEIKRGNNTKMKEASMK